MVLAFSPTLNAVSSDDRVESTGAATLAEVVRPGGLVADGGRDQRVEQLVVRGFARVDELPCFK